MKRCNVCQTECAVNAKFCGKCGYRFPEQKKKGDKLGTLIKIIAIFAFIAIVGYVINNMGDSTYQASIGEELKCFDYTITIDDFKFKTGSIDSYHEVPKGTEWIGLIVTAKNTSDNDVAISSSKFEVINSNGEILKYDAFSYKVYGNYDTLGAKLAPGGSKTGYISFSNTNTDNSNLIVVFKCGAWDNTYKIKLEK